MAATLETCEALVEVKALTPLVIWTGRTSILGTDAFIVQRQGKKLILIAGDECVEAAIRELVSNHRFDRLDYIAGVLPEELRRLLEVGRCGAEAEAEAIASPGDGEAILLSWKYPPETTIKGLIRTAVLTSILAEGLSGPNPEETLKDIQDSINSLARGARPKDAARRLEEVRLSLKIPVTNFRYDVFQRINVIFDSSEPKDMILDIFEVKEKDGASVARLNVVAIKPGSTFKYRVLITRLTRRVPRSISRGPDSLIKYLDSLDDKVAFCDKVRDSLNLYSKLLLESEVAKYKQLPDLRGFAKDLRSVLEKIEGGYMPLKLGLKAGHDSKTITPLLKAPQAAGIPSKLYGPLASTYQALTQYLSSIYRKLWDDKTITISQYTGKPVGWVAVRITW